MRGTVFAVAADTLAWLTQLCAAGPIRAATKRRPALGLEDAHVVRAEEVLEDVAAEHSTPGAGRGVLRAELLETWQRAGIRSEEHTSELQSRGHLVCRPLLEKKKAA